MHIVQALVSLNVGGSELVATELSEYLFRKGHRVTIVAADGPLGVSARTSGAEHLDWPIGKKRLQTWRYIKRLAAWMLVEKPDIVHAHSRFPAWICLQAIKRLPPQLRPVLVTTMHGHFSVSPYSAVMTRGAKTIAVSEHIRKYTLQNYASVNEHDVVVIHGGASRVDFPYQHQPPPDWRESVNKAFPELKDKRWLLLPGRITQWKGHDKFIRLIGSLVKDYPNIQGLFVGGGRTGSSYRLELEKLIKKTKVDGKITFTGNRLDIRDWMAESEIVFNLSNNPPEAFGRTVLESLCLGRPIIAWKHGGAAEILASMFAEGGVDPLDYQQLELRTRSFLESSPVVPKSDAFSLEDSMQKHLQIYEDIVSDRSQHP